MLSNINCDRDCILRSDFLKGWNHQISVDSMADCRSARRLESTQFLSWRYCILSQLRRNRRLPVFATDNNLPTRLIKRLEKCTLYWRLKFDMFFVARRLSTLARESRQYKRQCKNSQAEFKCSAISQRRTAGNKQLNRRGEQRSHGRGQ